MYLLDPANDVKDIHTVLGIIGSTNKGELITRMREFWGVNKTAAQDRITRAQPLLRADGTLSAGRGRSLMFGVPRAAAPPNTPAPPAVHVAPPPAAPSSVHTAPSSSASSLTITREDLQVLARMIVDEQVSRGLLPAASSAQQPQLAAAVPLAQLTAAQTPTTTVGTPPSSVPPSAPTPASFAPTPASFAPTSATPSTVAPTPSSAATPSTSDRPPRGIEGIPADNNMYSPLSKKSA